MIYITEDAVMVTGPGQDDMAQLCRVINNIGASLIRSGGDPQEIRARFHRLVDIAMDAPDDGVTIDLSRQKEG